MNRLYYWTHFYRRKLSHMKKKIVENLFEDTNLCIFLLHSTFVAFPNKCMLAVIFQLNLCSLVNSFRQMFYKITGEKRIYIYIYIYIYTIKDHITVQSSFLFEKLLCDLHRHWCLNPLCAYHMIVFLKERWSNGYMIFLYIYIFSFLLSFF